MVSAPPLFSPESEVAVIAAVMLDPDGAAAALDTLRPVHFGDPVHAAIFEAQVTLLRRGAKPLPAMIRDALGDSEPFRQWGGMAQLSELMFASTLLGLSDHVGAVVDRYLRRELIQIGSEAQALARDTASGTADEILSWVERQAADLSQRSSVRDQWIAAGDMVRGALDRAAARNGLITYPTGLADVDEMTNGFHAGELTIIGGRPGMAKTSVAGRHALASARKGLGVCFFSLEMGEDPMGIRLACDVAYRRQTVTYGALPPEEPNPWVSKVVANAISEQHRRRLREAEEEVAALPLLFDTRSALTLSQIEATARRAHRRWRQRGIEPGPVFVDHLGKVRPEKERGGSRHAETADTSNGLAEMAKRLHCPVVALAQLNRGVEGREDKRPGLADLRQAGELEEDARQVIFLYRPEYYLRAPTDPTTESNDQRLARTKKLTAAKNKLFFIIEKNSHGPVGQIEAFCDIACSAIRDRGLP